MEPSRLYAPCPNCTGSILEHDPDCNHPSNMKNRSVGWKTACPSEPIQPRTVEEERDRWKRYSMDLIRRLNLEKQAVGAIERLKSDNLDLRKENTRLQRLQALKSDIVSRLRFDIAARRHLVESYDYLLAHRDKRYADLLTKYGDLSAKYTDLSAKNENLKVKYVVLWAIVIAIAFVYFNLHC